MLSEALPKIDLTGQCAVVTGGSRGLGRQIVLTLRKAGCSVAAISRGSQELEQLVALDVAFANDSPGRLITIAADLRCRDSLPDVFSRCKEAMGGVDILINNAAIQGDIGRFVHSRRMEWEDVFGINFLAAAELCRLALPEMISKRKGKIVSLSGGGATGPRPDFSAYGASKAALVRFSETLAEEVRWHGIDVNCVAPGAMNTGMLQEVLSAGPEGATREHARAIKQQAEGGTSLTVGADLVLFLVSRLSDGISGRLISAPWDDWRALPTRLEALASSDVYTLRRITPKDRGLTWE